MVSHELRTPLTSLVGFAELLLKRDLSDAQRKQFVGVMLDEGKRLTTLLNDFLDLQRIESGRQQLSQVSLHLASLVERAAATISDADHPITVDLPDWLPAVRGDPDRLQQVLSNLLSNAKKYSPDGGEIVISGRSIGTMVELAIADHGLGIPSEALPHLFQKFYRIDNRIAGRSRGRAWAWLYPSGSSTSTAARSGRSRPVSMRLDDTIHAAAIIHCRGRPRR